MADQRSGFRFRFPWSTVVAGPRQPAAAPRPPAQPTTSTNPAPAPMRAAETQGPPQPTSTTTPTPPAQSTASATPAPTPGRAAETQVPPTPTSTTSPTPAQSSGSATPVPAPQRTAETQVPTQPTSTTTNRTTTQPVDTKTPLQPTSGTATTTMTPQTQPTATTIPSSATPQNAKTEAPSPPIAIKTPIPENTQTAQTQLPSQPTAPTTPTANTETAQTQPRSQSTAPTTPTLANTQRVQTQPPNQPAATATATITTSERPPFRPPGVTATKPPPPQASRTESQPSSPARAASESPVSSQPESPSRATSQSRSSQPSTPSRTATQSRATSVLSSPSRTGSSNSPTARKTSQSRSQPRTPSRPEGQTSSTSPSRKAAQGQPKTATLIESTIQSKGEPRLSPKGFQPASSSTDNPSMSEKEPKSTVPEQQSLEQLQPKDTKSGMIFHAQKQTPVETSTSLKESGMRITTVLTPTGGPQINVPTKTSDTPIRSGKPESFPENSKSEETKEVKENMQEKKQKTCKEDNDRDNYLLTRGLASAMQTKAQLGFIYQSEQAQQAVNQKEVMPTPASNGKGTKITGQPRNQTMSVESHQKPALNGENILHKEIRNDTPKLVQKMADQPIKDRPFSVITLAGENRGATMHLGTESMKKGGAVPIRRGYKLNPDESVETGTNGEGSSKAKSEDIKYAEDQAAEAFVNSNVQGINNSIMLNSSIEENNPGVHLVHSRFPIKKASTAETEFSTTHAQRLTYEPMVRRRCLRGLLLESSDTEPENTTKPRRHGCRVGSKETSKENKIDAF